MTEQGRIVGRIEGYWGPGQSVTVVVDRVAGTVTEKAMNPEMIIGTVSEGGFQRAAYSQLAEVPDTREALAEAIEVVRHATSGHRVDGLFLTPGIMRAVFRWGLVREDGPERRGGGMVTLAPGEQWTAIDAMLYDGTPIRLMDIRAAGPFDALRQPPPPVIPDGWTHLEKGMPK